MESARTAFNTLLSLTFLVINANFDLVHPGTFSSTFVLGLKQTWDLVRVAIELDLRCFYLVLLMLWGLLIFFRSLIRFAFLHNFSGGITFDSGTLGVGASSNADNLGCSSLISSF